MPTTIDGTTGVDQVQNGIVTNDKIANGAVTVPKLSATGTADSTTFLRGDGSWQAISTTPTTDQVLTATAGASVGAVGTYAFLHINTNNTTIASGATRAGSGLVYASIFPWVGGDTSTALGQAGSGVPSGTWRCMGQITAYDNNNYRGATLWLRIS
jgi:hypothetical protein